MPLLTNPQPTPASLAQRLRDILTDVRKSNATFSREAVIINLDVAIKFLEADAQRALPEVKL